MAEINFLPVCSNCRTILDDQLIDFIEDEIHNESPYVLLKNFHIVPKFCPKCKEYFSLITMPTELPVQSKAYRRG